LYRKWLRENRNFFGKVIIGISETNYQHEDAEFILHRDFGLENYIIGRSNLGLPDWRDDAVMWALTHVTSDWVLFMEQDFEIKTPAIMSRIEHLCTTVLGSFLSMGTFYGFKQGDRIHPGFLLVKSDHLLHYLSGYGVSFAPVPGVCDHFDTLTQHLEQDLRFFSLEEMGFNSPDAYEHMNGLTHNLYLRSIGQEVTYEPEQFNKYLERVQQLNDSYDRELPRQ